MDYAYLTIGGVSVDLTRTARTLDISVEHLPAYSMLRASNGNAIRRESSSVTKRKIRVSGSGEESPTIGVVDFRQVITVEWGQKGQGGITAMAVDIHAPLGLQVRHDPVSYATSWTIEGEED